MSSNILVPTVPGTRPIVLPQFAHVRIQAVVVRSDARLHLSWRDGSRGQSLGLQTYFEFWFAVPRLGLSGASSVRLRSQCGNQCAEFVATAKELRNLGKGQ